MGEERGEGRRGGEEYALMALRLIGVQQASPTTAAILH